MNRIEYIKDQFKGVYGSIDMYIDCNQFFFIDVDQDLLEGNRSITLSCGCCGDYEQFSTELSYELEFMDDIDFQELIEYLTKLKLK